jgi:hypothetical protein
MSYRLHEYGLGAAASTSAATSMATIPAAIASRLSTGTAATSGDPRDTVGIIPPECAAMSPQYRLPPDTIAPGQVFVVVYPFVPGDVAKIPEVLDLILGTTGGGGPALRSQLAAGRAFTFVAGGFIRDEKAVQSVTKGIVWIAVSPAAAKGRVALVRDTQIILNAAIAQAGLPASTVSTNLQWPVLATAKSDTDLLKAVYEGAVAGADFTSFVRLGPTSITMGRQAGGVRSGFSEMARVANSAQQTIVTVDTIAASVDAAISNALAMPREQAAQAIGMLEQVKAVVSQSLADLREGTRVAPSIITAAGPERENVLKEIRNAILRDAEGHISRFPTEVGRDYWRCQVLKLASRDVGATVSSVDSALTAGVAAAQFLVDNSPAIAETIAKLEDALKRIDDAMAQVPMGWLYRKHLGLPGWGWAGIGGVTFIGGALGLRALRKRSKKPVTTNSRRRRLKRTSR